MCSRSEPETVEAGTDVTDEADPGNGLPKARRPAARRQIRSMTVISFKRLNRMVRHLEWHRGNLWLSSLFFGDGGFLYFPTSQWRCSK